MTTRTFTKEQLRDEYDLPASVGEGEGCKVIIDDIAGKSRWAVEYRLVFQLPDQSENQAWQVYYRVGATESQEERPWENDDVIEATLVECVEVVVKKWRVVK